jgi:hypothetical protein
VVKQVFQGGAKLGVEFGQSGILVNVKVQEMAEDVVVLFEFELSETLIQGLDHLLCGHR